MQPHSTGIDERYLDLEFVNEGVEKLTSAPKRIPRGTENMFATTVKA